MFKRRTQQGVCRVTQCAEKVVRGSTGGWEPVCIAAHTGIVDELHFDCVHDLVTTVIEELSLSAVGFATGAAANGDHLHEGRQAIDDQLGG